MSEIFVYLDYIGTFAFATTGASIAGRARFDFFGMLFLAFLTAVGGGTTRDLIIRSEVFWTVNPIYLYIVFIATLSTFFLKNFYKRQLSLLLFLDTLGVGVFVVIGTHKTLLSGFNNETALIMGTVTAVLGGIIRSAFSKEASILSNKELYASVAGISALLFIVLKGFDLNVNYCAMAALLSTFLIRYMAIKYKIELPAFKD